MKYAIFAVLIALNLQGCLSTAAKAPVNVASISSEKSTGTFSLAGLFPHGSECNH